jgi:protein-S-isoprenylcysteine O-methyltransferase Ste14
MSATARALLVAVGAFLYLALPIVAWGGLRPFFAHPALIGLTLVLIAMCVVAFLAGGNISQGVREDRSNRWVIAAFSVIGLLAGYLPAYADRNEFWTLDGEAIRWVGVVLFAVGLVLRIWPVFVLGNRFSGLVAIQPGHQLVTTGVYRRIRNPSYLGLLVSMLGWALAFRSVVGILLATMLIPPLIARMRSEERLLRSEFGDEYDAYCARTWRLIPWLY